MNECLCAQTRRAARLLTSVYEAELGRVGLTVAQFEVLTLLRRRECNGRAIARMLLLDTTTVSRNLKLLLAAGLVRSRPGSSDARQILYSLSSSGAALLRKAEPHWAAAQSKMAARLNRPLAQMMRSLKELEEAAS